MRAEDDLPPDDNQRRRIKRKREQNDKRGKIAEDFFALFAEWLIARDPRFIKYIRSRPGGEMDSHHFDGLFFLRGGLTLPVQIKASNKGVQDHIDHYGSYIKFVVAIEDHELLIGNAKNIEDLFEALGPEAIERSFRSLQRSVNDFLRQAVHDFQNNGRA